MAQLEANKSPNANESTSDVTVKHPIKVLLQTVTDWPMLLFMQQVASKSFKVAAFKISETYLRI